MTEPQGTEPEAVRLEELWAGAFGDAYVDRNIDAYVNRGPFWNDLCERHGLTSVLEIGCNVGGNLRWLSSRLQSGRVYGVDINRKAIAHLRSELPDVNAIWSPGRDLPFRDRWFDLVFTMGVLIHQPESTLPLVMAEMVRCSTRFVLCAEYFAENSVEIAYHGESGALFKRNYGQQFADLFPQIRLIESGFLGRDEGWDDLTWWLFERQTC